MSVTTATAAAPADASTAHASTDGRAVIQGLKALRRATAPRDVFWQRFVQGVSALCRAPAALVIARADAAGEWTVLAGHGLEALDSPAETGEGRLVGGGVRLAERALTNGFAFEPIRKAIGGLRQPTLVGIALDAMEGQALLLLLIDPASQQQVSEAAIRALLVADLPSAAPAEREDDGPLAEVLDILIQVQRKDRFFLAAMVAVNAIASRFNGSRVSLGWKAGDYVHIRAISHTERFERKTDAVQDLETVLEEAYDQDEEILWPGDETSGVVTVAHRRFAGKYGVTGILTLPLRRDDAVVGVLCCERIGHGFDAAEGRALRLLASQLVPWLAELHRRDRWFGARLAAETKRSLAGLLKTDRVVPKTLGAVATLAVLYGVLGTWTYRVEGTFKLSTDGVALLTTPFDGYVKKVSFTAGEVVTEGRPLLTLDTRETLMREAEIIAELHRATREAEKARARNELAEMRIAEAQTQQARTQLERVKYYLDHAVIRAPFDGVVVEGDVQKLNGAAVAKGDTLMRVARIDDLYAEINVDERDIDEVAVGTSGELALLSRPDLRVPFIVEHILPVAEVKEGAGNVFVVRARINGGRQPWWRPGMSGLAKIEIGERRIAWILLHRTIDFLRVRLWW